MEPIVLAIILGILERAFAMIVGGLSLYFGYKLLVKKPGKKSDSRGKIALPGGGSIDLNRVGPGVFFALFGAIVVALSLYNTISYTETITNNPDSSGQVVREFSGVGSSQELSVDAARELLQQDIIFINKTLPTVLRTDLSAEQQASLEIDIEQVKLDLMQTVWDDDWGDYTEFKELVQSGALDKAPQELQSAVEYFRQGQGE
jgi:hypothetical protein